jgi:1-phosphofructokinase family hexose kinase
MILCVTLNPCLDKTLVTPAWKPGDAVRGRSYSHVVGGKGNNVARALKRLGRVARPVTFFGGIIGAHCERLLQRDDGFDPIVTETSFGTRVITTVRGDDTESTAFFDPDPEITVEEAAELVLSVEKALKAGGVDALVMSGSSPSVNTNETYSELIALARARRVPTFLDTYGPPLNAIWGFWPSTMQLNRKEAGIYLNTPDPSDHDLLGLLTKWASHGVSIGIVTDGSNPVFAFYHKQFYRITPPSVEVINPVGSGDCLVAGLVDARLKGVSIEESFRHAIGAAVANTLVWEAGAIDPETVAAQAEQVVIEAI